MNSNPECHEPSNFGARRMWRRRVAMTGGALVVILCILGLLLYLAYGRTASLYSLVPENCTQLVAGDAPWWWDSLKDVRHEPYAMLALGMLRKQLGISIEKDVIPWVGQVGFTVMDTGTNESQAAVFVQIRDLRLFAKRSGRLYAASTRGGSLAWHDLTYHGISFRQSRVPQGYGPPIVVSTAIIRRWIVMGIGDGAIERVIDVWQGRTPSMAQSAYWSKALARLPQNSKVVWAMDTSRTLDLMGKSGFKIDPSISKLDFLDTVAIHTLIESDGGLRIQTVSVPRSARARNYWKAFKRNIKPITGSAMKQLPEGASAVILFSSPGSWLKQLRSTAMEAVKDSSERASLSNGFQQMKPFDDIANQLDGDCAAVLSWTEDKGCGIAALGETRNAGMASDIAQKLNRLAVSDGEDVVKDGSVYEIPPEGWIAEDFKGLPCWTSRGRWFILGSYPVWLSPVPKSHLELPQEAEGSDAAFIVNFRSLAPVLAQWLKGSAAASQYDVLDTLHNLGLERAEVLGWARFDPAGRWQQSVVSIPNFDWRKALKTAAKSAVRFDMPLN